MSQTSKQTLWDLVSILVFIESCTTLSFGITNPFFFPLDDTPFAGGIFKCKLVIDGEFPQKPPKGYFLNKIFHPNVAQPSGEICVNELKRDWNP